MSWNFAVEYEIKFSFEVLRWIRE